MVDKLLNLAHTLGSDSDLAILAEGNVSVKNGNVLTIKSSGTSLKELTEKQLTDCCIKKLNFIIDNEVSCGILQSQISDSKMNASHKKPSMEVLFHAWLQRQEGVKYIAHCHPTATMQILCTSHATTFANKRLFPDQVICCGKKSCLVPYAEPGLPLLKEIKKSVTQFFQKENVFPSLILLKNHGIISTGTTAEEVLSSVLMCEKAAKIFIGAQSIGKIDFLSQKDVNNLMESEDEKYRLKIIKDFK